MLAKYNPCRKNQLKKKYLTACLEQRRHFAPFVVSTDGLIGCEAAELLLKGSRSASRTILLFA
jgi:hypothetical protein